MASRNFILSFDVEWAPDWIVSEIAEGLAARGVKSTWFATHPSDLLSEMAGDPMFEVGLHPNFLPGSTQGGTEDEVLSAMLAWFPDAKCVRTHSLYQSEPLLQKMASSYGIEIDCSVFLPGCGNVEPHKVRWPGVSESLTCVPHVFQDNVHMGLGAPWHLENAVPQCGSPKR